MGLASARTRQRCSGCAAVQRSARRRRRPQRGALVHAGATACACVAWRRSAARPRRVCGTAVCVGRSWLGRGRGEQPAHLQLAHAPGGDEVGVPIALPAWRANNNTKGRVGGCRWAERLERLEYSRTRAPMYCTAAYATVGRGGRAGREYAQRVGSHICAKYIGTAISIRIGTRRSFNARLSNAQPPTTSRWCAVAACSSGCTPAHAVLTGNKGTKGTQVLRRTYGHTEGSLRASSSGPQKCPAPPFAHGRPCRSAPPRPLARITGANVRVRSRRLAPLPPPRRACGRARCRRSATPFGRPAVGAAPALRRAIRPRAIGCARRSAQTLRSTARR